jgi:hypothetical protein
MRDDRDVADVVTRGELGRGRRQRLSGSRHGEVGLSHEGASGAFGSIRG